MRTTLLIAAALSCSGCIPIRVPDIARQYNDQCAVLLTAGDLDQAEAACAQALEYQPQYWDALHNMGLICEARGDTERAKTFFRKSLRANPDMAQSYNSLGTIAAKERNYTAARDYFMAALRVNPDYAEARANLASACLRSNDLDGAERAYRQLVLSSPNLSEAHAGLGVVMMLKQRPGEAVGWFSKAVQLEARYAAGWKGLGAAYESLGRVDEARDAWETCLDANPDDLECRQALSRSRSSSPRRRARRTLARGVKRNRA